MATFFLFFLILTAGLLMVLGFRKMSMVVWILLIISFLLIGGGFLPAILAKPLESAYPILNPPQWQKRNAIILLGGGVTLPRGNKVTPGNFSYPRIHEALRLYLLCKKTVNECKIIITGGIGDYPQQSEAAVYRDDLLRFGVLNTDIILEERSKNTAENAKFTVPMLMQGKYDQIFLVTSAVHLKRSLLYFADLGIYAIPAPANYLVAKISIIPRGYKIAFTDFILHEYGGIIKFYIFNWLGSK